MKRALGVICILILLTTLSVAQNAVPLSLTQSIALPDVQGDFDHMAIDVKGRRLFVPAEQQRALEVIDIPEGKLVHTITGLEGNPRKVVYVSESNQIWVDLGNEVCKAFSGESYAELKTIKLNPDSPPEANREPDNGVYDAKAGLFYIGDRGDRSVKGAKGSIEIVDTKAGTYAGSITVDDSDPAALALDPSSDKLYVVLGMTSRVAVIDRKQRKVIDTWPVTGGPLPHAIALDAAHQRLFVGSRVEKGHTYKPGKLVIMDTNNGKIIKVLDSEGGVDELVYDPRKQRIYFTGTTGGIDVFQQVDPDHYTRLGLMPTGPLAKTSLLVPEMERLFVAVPNQVGANAKAAVPESKEKAEDAKIMVFHLVP